LILDFLSIEQPQVIEINLQ